MKNQLKSSLLMILGILALLLKSSLNPSGALNIFLICLSIFFIVSGVFIYIKHNSIINIAIDAILEFVLGIF